VGRSSKKPFFTLKPSDVRELLRRALTACVVPLSDLDRYRQAVENATDSELEQIGRRWWRFASTPAGQTAGPGVRPPGPA